MQLYQINIFDIIIVALGVDKAQTELEVTAQIAIPQATNEQATNSDAIITAKGANDSLNKSNIIAAVEAVTGLAMHKIQVFEVGEN